MTCHTFENAGVARCGKCGGTSARNAATPPPSPVGGGVVWQGMEAAEPWVWQKMGAAYVTRLTTTLARLIRDRLTAFLNDAPPTRFELSTAVDQMDAIRRDRRIPMRQRDEADMLMFLLEGELHDMTTTRGARA